MLRLIPSYCTTRCRSYPRLADRTLRNESIDAGTSIAAFDATGTPIEARDERGALTLTAADEMLRSTHQWGRDASTDPVRLVGRTLFGHEMTGPKATNHLGKPHRHFDEAGVVTLEAYDFKGNVLEKVRETIDPQLMIDAVDAASSANNYVVDTFRVDWTPATGETLADRIGELVDIENSPYRTAYKSKTIFDGLNRPVEMTLPADEDSSVGADYGKTVTPRFNRAGALQSVAMSGTDTPSVDYIAYNARGQRILAALGNGVMTRYAYDENIFRLSRMRSEKYKEGHGVPRRSPFCAGLRGFWPRASASKLAMTRIDSETSGQRIVFAVLDDIRVSKNSRPR